MNENENINNFHSGARWSDVLYGLAVRHEVKFSSPFFVSSTHRDGECLLCMAK
jgi:hypothetical protein